MKAIEPSTPPSPRIVPATEPARVLPDTDLPDGTWRRSRRPWTTCATPVTSSGALSTPAATPGCRRQAYRMQVRSDRPAHPALVTIEEFLAVATIHAQPVRPRPSHTSDRGPAPIHRVGCAVCDRIMTVSSKDGRVRYRC